MAREADPRTIAMLARCMGREGGSIYTDLTVAERAAVLDSRDNPPTTAQSASVEDCGIEGAYALDRAEADNNLEAALARARAL